MPPALALAAARAAMPKDPFAAGGPSGAPSYLDRGEEDPLQTVPPGLRRAADPLGAAERP